MTCKVCDKHSQSQIKMSPDFISERSGWRLFHYPQEPGERVIRGHLLLEASRHIVDLADLTEPEACEMGSYVRNAVSVLRQHLGAEHVYMFRINDKVPHLHVHLIPRYKLTPKDFWGTNITNWTEGPRVGVDGVKVLVDELRLKIT